MKKIILIISMAALLLLPGCSENDDSTDIDVRTDVKVSDIDVDTGDIDVKIN